MLKNSFLQLLEVSLMISPLIIFIFLLRKKSLRRLGSTARLLLWVPLLIQLAIPVQLTSVHSPYQKLTTIPLTDSFTETVEQIETAPIIVHSAQTALSMPPDTPVPQTWTWGEGLVMLWVLGMIVMMTVNGIARVKLKKRLCLQPCSAALGEEAVRQMRINRCLRIPVRQSANLHSCAIYGNLMPQLVLGADFKERTETQRRVMLDHECLHVKYGHPWFLGFIQLLEIVYWFNPLVYLMMNLLEGKSQAERIGYARLLLALSADHDELALQCLNSKRTQKRFKERLGWIVNKKRTPWLLAAGIVLICAGVSVGMMVKPDAHSGWEMTMKPTLIQNEAAPVELADTHEIKVWCEGSKKALESMGMEVPVIVRSEAWVSASGEALTLTDMQRGAESLAQLEFGEIPESVTCFMPTDQIFVKLTSDQLLQPYPEADGASAVARIEAISPVENPEITCGWGCYADHQALDITDPDNKQAPILATAAGTVNTIGFNSIDGNYIILDHVDGIQSFYGHLGEIQVAEGDTVTQGQTIGIMGMSGRATGPHVHFYLIQNETALDPSSLYQ
mgnify:CR=1 FL=1